MAFQETESRPAEHVETPDATNDDVAWEGSGRRGPAELSTRQVGNHQRRDVRHRAIGISRLNSERHQRHWCVSTRTNPGHLSQDATTSARVRTHVWKAPEGCVGKDREHDIAR